MVILGGVLQRNPFFVPPAEFLAELRERGSIRFALDGSIAEMENSRKKSGNSGACFAI